VWPIRLPTLAERRDDVVLLCNHFCRKMSSETYGHEMTMSARATRAARLHEWPGNVRELAHAVRRAVVRAQDDGVCVVGTHHLFPDRDVVDPGRLSLRQARRDFDRSYLLEALTRNGWNVCRTARDAEVSRSTVYTMIDDLELPLPLRANWSA